MAGILGMRPSQPRPGAPAISRTDGTRPALTLQLLHLHLPEALLAQRPGHLFALAAPQGVLAGAQGVADVGVGDEHGQLGVRQWHQACLQGPGVELEWGDDKAKCLPAMPRSGHALPRSGGDKGAPNLQSMSSAWPFCASRAMSWSIMPQGTPAKLCSAR